MNREALKVLSVIVLRISMAFPYGEKVDTIPIWQERAVLVLINACRIAPEAYRDRFLKSDSILLPEYYPTVPPLYWNRNMNASSRYHCVEMANGCGLQHNCNGTTYDTRIRDFYSEGNYLGENIAQGYHTPQQAVNGWLLDEYPPGTIAPDGSGTDGHRKNIMSKNYTVTGCGYYTAISGKSVIPYWCQDFGSGSNTYAYHPVPAATHLFLENGMITFMVIFYKPAAKDIQISLILEGVNHPMSLQMGSTVNGVYETSLPTGSICRDYYFEAQFNAGERVLYPEKGFLLTTGEGACTQDYRGETMVILEKWCKSTDNPGVVCSGGRLHYYKAPTNTDIVQTDLFDSHGRKIECLQWDNGSTSMLSPAIGGFIIMQHLFSNGVKVTETTVINRR